MTSKVLAGFAILAVVTATACSKSTPKIDLKTAEANGPSAAELAPIFKLGSDHTDLQREAKEKEIKGKIVDWKGLKLYEVKRSGDSCYRLHTSDTASAPGTFIKTCPEEAATKTMIEALKTGDWINAKGVISDITLRNIELDPAIVTADVGGSTADSSSPATKAAGSAGSPEKAPGKTTFKVSKLKPSLRDAIDKKRKYLKVAFSVTASEKPEKGIDISARFRCSVKGENVVTKSSILASFSEMSAGDTKQAEAMGWGPGDDSLEEKPTSCTIVLEEGPMFGDSKTNLGTWCFTPPDAIADGACSK